MYAGCGLVATGALIKFRPVRIVCNFSDRGSRGNRKGGSTGNATSFLDSFITFFAFARVTTRFPMVGNHCGDSSETTCELEAKTPACMGMNEFSFAFVGMEVRNVLMHV